MPRLVHSLPKYRKHRASGQAIVTLAGQDHYLGPHGTNVSKMRYDRLIAEFITAGRRGQQPLQATDGVPLIDLLAAYWRHCKSYYVKNGKPTNEQDAYRLIIKDVRALYEDLPANSFGPKCLKAVRERWINRQQARPTINKNMRRLTRVFKWAVAEELVPPSVYQALSAVPGLKKGRCSVPEPPPVLPVGMVDVERTLPFLPEIVQDMVRLQLFSGMRPGEVCGLRPADVDRTTDIWEYRPVTHKTEHHQRGRVVYLGPEAQSVLRSYLLRDASSHCFSPYENMQKYRENLHSLRKTPLSCGNRPGSNRVKSPRKGPRDFYDPNSYRQAVHRACDLANPADGLLARHENETKANWLARLGPEQKLALKVWQAKHRWSPNQLRHTAATQIRKRFGLEAAQVILGHAAADVTQVYAERDADKAREVARQIG